MSAYEGFAIVELMGHRRLAGRVSEADQYGTRMLQVDVPVDDEGGYRSQWYGGGSIYCVTPVDEATARRLAKHLGVRSPVQPWELDQAPQLPAAASDAGDDQEDDEGEDDIPW